MDTNLGSSEEADETNVEVKQEPDKSKAENLSQQSRPVEIIELTPV